MGRTACTEPQYLYKRAVYLFLKLTQYIGKLMGQVLMFFGESVHVRNEKYCP